MSILPEYQETHRQFEAIIKNPPQVKDTEQIRLLSQFSKDVGDGEKTLLEEIRALAGATFDVDDSFRNIVKIFEKVETQGISPELARDISNLKQSWNTHHRKFTDLVWRSREVAGKAMAAALDFCGNFVPFLGDNSVSVAEKKKEVENYMKELDKDQGAAQDMSQGFTDLQKNVQAFQVEWKRVIDKYDLDAMNARIQDLDKLIQNLETTLTDLNNKIKELTVAIGALSAVSGILGFLSFICPIFIIGGLIGVASVAVAAKLKADAEAERRDVNARIDSSKKERAMLQATVKALQQLKAGLDGSQSDLNLITAKLGTFAHVWAVIRADLQAIKEKLDYAVGTDSEVLFKARLNNASKLYASLAKGLREYQNVVTRPLNPS